MDEEGEGGPTRLLVVVDKDRVVKDDGSQGKIGVHSGRRVHADIEDRVRGPKVGNTDPQPDDWLDMASNLFAQEGL